MLSLVKTAYTRPGILLVSRMESAVLTITWLYDRAGKSKHEIRYLFINSIFCLLTGVTEFGPYRGAIWVKRYFHQFSHPVVFFLLHINVNPVPEAVYIFYMGIGSKQPVPDRKNISIVGVCVWLDIMMVNLMHIRRNDYPAQDIVQPQGQGDVGVVELGEQD
jgi:hypothetical protein